MVSCSSYLWKRIKYYRIERDEEIIADLIRIEKDFWEDHVMKKVLPEPDGSKTADSIIAEYFQNTNHRTIMLTGFDEQLRRR